MVKQFTSKFCSIHTTTQFVCLDFCNETMKGNKPEALSRFPLISLPKKGDLSLPSNYRGITLSALAAKLYNTMLLNRISPHLDPILRRNQNGFRKGRSTTPQILALRRLIEELKISNKQATLHGKTCDPPRENREKGGDTGTLV